MDSIARSKFPEDILDFFFVVAFIGCLGSRSQPVVVFYLGSQKTASGHWPGYKSVP